MRNDAYWQRRFSELKLRQINKGEEYYETLILEYQRAIKSLDSDISYWYQRLADNNSLTLAETRKFLKASELSEFKWTVEEYIKRGRQFGIDASWAKELENASARVHISRYDSLKIQMRQHLEELTAKNISGMKNVYSEIYEDTFYRSAYELQKGLGVGTRLDRIDYREIESILDTPWAADGSNFSSKVWTDKQKLINTLNTELKQGLQRGDSLNKIIDSISDSMGVSQRRSRALVRTESAAISSMARQRAFNELDVEKYQIDATLDNKTSDKCRRLDQTVFDMVDYEIGVTASPFHTNCRTCEVPYFDDEFTQDEVRAVRDEDGNIDYVSGDMSYQSWYNKYVYKPKTVKLDEVRSTIRKLGFDDDGTMKFIPNGAEITDVTIIAGTGTSTVHRAAERAAKLYGGDASDWLKMAGKVESQQRIFDIHWVEHNDLGIENMKIKDWKNK